MKKIWSYLAVGFAFFSGGIIFAVKFLSDKTIYKGNFKFKQRGKGNEQNSEITVETGTQTKRDERKQTKIIAKNKKKAAKSAKRLQKRL